MRVQGGRWPRAVSPVTAAVPPAGAAGGWCGVMVAGGESWLDFKQHCQCVMCEDCHTQSQAELQSALLNS